MDYIMDCEFLKTSDILFRNIIYVVPCLNGQHLRREAADVCIAYSLKTAVSTYSVIYSCYTCSLHLVEFTVNIRRNT